MKNKNILREFTYPKIVGFGFILLITIGTVLLMLPISSRDGHSAGFINSFFTSVSASCVTGLIVYDTYLHWNIFGQIVILCLIQIGGLGFLTILTMFSMLLRRKIGLKERTLLQESVNTMYIGGIVKLVRKILTGTAVIEITGAVLFSVRLIPRMGMAKGIYTSVFMSVSAFCNAGFDLMGQYGEFSSLVTFFDDALINITVVMLITLGGIGFFVWDDISRNKHHFSRYQLHTKIVLIITAGMTIFGTAFFWIAENNHLLEGMSIKDKFLVSLFSSVTPRTAGFNTVDTANLTPASELLTIMYMFVGGSPGSTAGGAKTTTITVIVVCVWANLRNSASLNIFKRRLEDDALKKACSVVCFNLSLILTASLLICTAQSEIPLSDVLFETFSAINTVGMTTGITRELNDFSLIITACLMYFGRVGSLSFALIFTEQKHTSTVQNPVEKINIG